MSATTSGGTAATVESIPQPDDFALQVVPEDSVTSMSFSPNQGLPIENLAITSWDGTVKLYQTAYAEGKVDANFIAQEQTEEPLFGTQWSDDGT